MTWSDTWTSSEFDAWFDSLPSEAKGLIVGYVDVFSRYRDQIEEPYGAPVMDSRFAPMLFALYPAKRQFSYCIFCLLRNSKIILVNGYDVDVHLDRKSMLAAVDDVIASLENEGGLR